MQVLLVEPFLNKTGTNDWQNIAANFQRVFNKTKDLDDCDTAVDAAGKTLSAMERPGLALSHFSPRVVRVGLARTQLVRYSRLKSIADLSKSKDIYQESLKEWSPENIFYQSCEEDLVSVAKGYMFHSISLQAEFESSPKDGVLDSVLEAASQAFEILSRLSDWQDLAPAVETKRRVLELGYDNNTGDPALKQAFEMALLGLHNTEPSDPSSASHFDITVFCENAV
jgi:hypothetical protein